MCVKANTRTINNNRDSTKRVQSLISIVVGGLFPYFYRIKMYRWKQKMVYLKQESFIKTRIK